MREPETIEITPEKITVPQIELRYVDVGPRNKLDALTRLLDVEVRTAALVFCRTRGGVDELGEALVSRGYAAGAIHGDLSQAPRDRVVARFRPGPAAGRVASGGRAR